MFRAWPKINVTSMNYCMAPLGSFLYVRVVITCFFFLVSAESREKCGGRFLSPGIMLNEVATLAHLIESSKPAARAGRQLDRAAEGAPTPREATVPRRTSRAQRLARQRPPRHENSWRFRGNLGYVGESVLSTGRIELSLCTALSVTSRGMGMTLGITLIYPVQCRVVTRLTRRCGTFPRYGKLSF